jgi:hypothetical protein
MARRFPDPKHAGTADSVAWTRLLVGDLDADERAKLLKLARFASQSEPESWSYRETLGAALYRAGKFTDAVVQLTIAIEKEGNRGTIWQGMLLAMAHSRLGQDKEALYWLTRAVKQIQEREKGKPLPRWDEQVQWWYLRQEAERTLRWRVPPSSATESR